MQKDIYSIIVSAEDEKEKNNNETNVFNPIWF